MHCRVLATSLASTRYMSSQNNPKYLQTLPNASEGGGEAATSLPAENQWPRADLLFSVLCLSNSDPSELQ